MKDPNFDILFSIGRFHIYWYAILLVAGIVAGMMITDRRAKSREVPGDIALDLCILGVPFGVLGGRLFRCLSGSIPWSSFFDLTRSGLSFFGSVIFASSAILVYLKHRKISVGEMLDIAAPGVFAAIAITVWGDFFNRVHYGPLVERTGHKWFPLATFGNDLKIHYAAFFYEFLLCIILIVIYYVLLRKRITRKADRFLLMTLGYCLGRFFIDSIRQDLIMVGGIAFDQLCEIALSVICLLLLFVKRHFSKVEEKSSERSQRTDEEEKDRPAEPNKPSEPMEVGDMKDEPAEAPSSESIEEKTFSGLS